MTTPGQGGQQPAPLNAPPNGVAYGAASVSPAATSVTVVGGTVTISGPVAVTVDGTPTVDLAPGSTVEITGDVTFSNDVINVIGAGGYLTPGQITSVYANSATLTAAASGNDTQGPFNVATYASLDFLIQGPANSSTANGAALCAVVEFEWQDTSGNLLGLDTMSVVTAGEIAGAIPCRGPQVSIVLINAGSVGSMTWTAGKVRIYGSFRTVDSLRFSVGSGWTGAFTPQGLQAGSNGPPVDIIGGWIANIDENSMTAGDIYIFPLPVYNGLVSGYYEVLTDALDNDAVIIDLAQAVQGGIVAGTANNAVLANLPSAITPSGSTIPVSFYMPPSQCAMIIKPSSTGSSVTLVLTAQA